jgi:hypothetical protein
MIGQGLRQLQEALNRRADSVQHEFISVGEKLQGLNRQILDAHGDERTALLAEQESLRNSQQELAGTINIWRDRARAATHQRSDSELRLLVNQLADLHDDLIQSAVEQVLYLLNASPEEMARLAASQQAARPTTPAGRLVERGRTEFDLRGKEIANRQKAAFEFANRPRMAQDDAALAELETALTEAKDPLVAELITLTIIQMHRFRATRLADLDIVHQSVERLTQVKHPAVISTLIEIMDTPRSGYARGPHDMAESNNLRSRLAAMECLAAWGTPEARSAIQKRQFDRDAAIAAAAAKTLDTMSQPPAA